MEIMMENETTEETPDTQEGQSGSQTEDQGGNTAGGDGADGGSNAGGNGSQVDTGRKQRPANKSGDGKGGNALPPGLKKDLFKLRESLRQANARAEQYQQELETLRSSSGQRKSNEEGSGKPNFFDNPDEALERRDQDLLKKFDEMLESKSRQRSLVQEAGKAEEWLLSQPEIEADMSALEEIREMYEDPAIKQMAKVSPLRTVKLVIQEWKEKKGLSGGKDGRPSGARGGGPGPSGSSSNGAAKVWTRKEIETYLSPNLDDKEFAKREAEIDKAMREGRIK